MTNIIGVDQLHESIEEHTNNWANGQLNDKPELAKEGWWQHNSLLPTGAGRSGHIGLRPLQQVLIALHFLIYVLVSISFTVCSTITLALRNAIDSLIWLFL